MRTAVVQRMWKNGRPAPKPRRPWRALRPLWSEGTRCSSSTLRLHQNILHATCKWNRWMARCVLQGAAARLAEAENLLDEALDNALDMQLGGPGCSDGDSSDSEGMPAPVSLAFIINPLSFSKGTSVNIRVTWASVVLALQVDMEMPGNMDMPDSIAAPVRGKPPVSVHQSDGC